MRLRPLYRAWKETKRVLLTVLRFGQDGLEIHHGRAVDRFNGPHTEPEPLDFSQSDAMEPEWIGSIGRAGGKNAGERNLRISPGMYGKPVPRRRVKPSDQDDILSFDEALKSVAKRG